MAVGDVYKTQIVYDVDGVQCRNIVNLRITQETGPGFDDSGIADATKQLADAMALQQSDRISHQGVVVQKIFPVSEPTSVFQNAIQGGVDFNVLPARLSITLNYYCEVYQPKRRYNLRISGIPQSVTQGNRLDFTYLGAWSPLILLLTSPTGIVETQGTVRCCTPQVVPGEDPPYPFMVQGNVNPVTTTTRSRAFRLA